MTTKIYEEDDKVFGNNTLRAKDMFEQRLAYQNIYPDAVYFSDPTMVESDSTNAIDNFLLDEDKLSGITSPQPINFWTSKYSLYGRKDSNGNCVYPKQDKLKQIRTATETVHALNFVVDAFEDFIHYIKTERVKKLQKDNFLTGDIQAKRGWFDQDESYRKITDQLYVSFVEDYLAQNNLSQRIVDFETFLEVFINLYMADMMPSYPLTKTGLLESTLLPPNVSGLCIEMSKDDHGDDINKFNKYLNNINFELYTLAAAKFGFFVDKNAPWRLVANLNSKAMKEYIQKYFFIIEKEGIVGFIPPNEEYEIYGHLHSYQLDENNDGSTVGSTDAFGNLAVPQHQHEIVNGVMSIVSKSGSKPIPAHTHAFGLNKKFVKSWTMNEFYKLFYTSPYLTEVDQLRDYFRNIYNQFVSKRPRVQITELCPKNKSDVGNYYTASSTRKTILKTIKREVLTADKFNKKYNDLFWLKTYLIIRIKEKTSGKGELDSKLDKVMSDINQLYYFVDKQSVISYINQYLKQYY